MWLRRLRIRHFRNIEDAEIDLVRGVNVWIGDNGHGKTSALQALHVLAEHRYPPGIGDMDVVQWNAPWMEVRAVMVTAEDTEVVSRYGVALGEPRRRVREGPILPAVWFGPADLSTVKGGPGERRDFLSQVAATLYPRYSPLLRRLERAVMQKNRGLREHWPSPALDSFNEIVATTGATVWQLRKATLDRLLPHIYAIHRQLSATSSLAIQFQQGGMEGDLVLEAEEVRRRLNARFGEERQRMVSLVGPHRDDLGVELDQHSARTYASQGQQRTIALAMKLAIYHVYEEFFQAPPLVMLDDVFSELDGRRRALILEYMARHDQQTVITDTEPRDLGTCHPTFYRVVQGVFQPWP